MSEIKSILCPIDFSTFSTRGYRHALSLARHYHAMLFVQHIVELWKEPAAGFTISGGLYMDFRRQLLANAESALQKFIKKHADNELQPHCIVDEGVAPDAILAFAKARQIDLIVMGVHDRRWFDRLVQGSVTEQVMRNALCPVLTVHSPSQDLAISKKKDDPLRLNKILFCTDFSENSQRALTYALSLALEYDAELILLHVLEGLPVSGSIKKAIAAATEKLERLVPPEVRKTIKHKAIVRIGKPYEQIIQLATEAHTDIMVMAVCSRSAIDLAVFGSTTHRAVLLGPCPVLAVHI